MVPNNKDSNRDSALDVQVGGDHYRKFQIQPIVFTHCNGLNDIQSAVIWYICRYNLKGSPLKDLQKAKHFIDILIELEGLNEYSCSDAGHPQTQPERNMQDGYVDWNTYLHNKLYGVEQAGQDPANYQRSPDDS